MDGTTESTFWRTVWSIWSWFVFGVCILVCLPVMALVWLVTAPFDPSRYWAVYLFRKVPVVHQKLNPLWTFRVGGTMPVTIRNPYVVVSNHESFVDILLISHLKWEMKWLSKRENFKIPVAGWLMRMARYIELDRKDPASAGQRDGGVPAPSRRRCVGHDLPRGDPVDLGGSAAVQGRGVPPGDPGRRAGAATRGARCGRRVAGTRLASGVGHRRGAGPGAGQHRRDDPRRPAEAEGTRSGSGSWPNWSRWVELRPAAAAG